MTFDEFFSKLLGQPEFSSAFNQINQEEQECVRDMARRLFRSFKISDDHVGKKYIEGVCATMTKERSCGSVGAIERALCNECRGLKRREIAPSFSE